LSLPAEFLADLPENLSPLAAGDLIHILDTSLERWGLHVARKTRARLLRRCVAIGSGSALGHRRSNVATERPILFLVEEPFVIAYDPATRRVLRILDGARDVGRLVR